MRRLYVPLVSFLFAPPSAGFAQDDPNATRGVYGPNPTGSYVRPGSNGGYVRLPSAVQDQPTAPQDDSNTMRGVYGPGQNGVPLRQPTAIFPGRSPVPIPNNPAVTVSGPAAAGQALPSAIIPTPIPGEPGMGSVFVNGHHAIVEQGTNRIVRYVD
jgi:hypothetical protein